MSMNNEIKLGGRKSQDTVNLQKSFEGVKAQDFQQNSNAAKIANALAGKDGVLDTKDLGKLNQLLSKYSDHGRISESEANRIIKELGFDKKDIKASDLFEFLQIGSTKAQGVQYQSVEGVRYVTGAPDEGGFVSTEGIDDNGRVTLSYTTDKEGNTVYMEKIDYDDDGNISQRRTDNNGIVSIENYEEGVFVSRVEKSGAQTATFNANGQCIKVEHDLGNGIVDITENEYSTDAQGNSYVSHVKSTSMGEVIDDYSCGPDRKPIDGKQRIYASQPCPPDPEAQKNTLTYIENTYKNGEVISSKTVYYAGNYEITDLTVDPPVTKKFDKNGNEIPAGPSISSFKDALANANGKVTIDETGSTQRLTGKPQWETQLSVPKSAEYGEDGLPDKIAIQLPEAGYGVGAYQTLTRTEKDDGTVVYKDRSGLREFKLEVDADGNISLKQLGAEEANDNIKDTLNKWTRTTIDSTIAKFMTPVDTDNNGVTDKYELNITSDNGQELIDMLSDRNKAWSVLNQLGAGEVFKALGEAGFNTYAQLKPALDALLSRIPSNVRSDAGPYKNIEDIIREISADFDAQIDTSKLEALDGQLWMLHSYWFDDIQGTNFDRNVRVSVNMGEADILNIDGVAEFSYPEPNGAMRSRALYLNGSDAYKFDNIAEVDAAGNPDNAIVNDSTGNNRKGELHLNPAFIEQGACFRDWGSSDNEIPIIVEDGVAYVSGYDKDGNPVKYEVDDVLNGRKPFPLATAPTPPPQAV